jgi:hypothetical protein
MAIDLELQKKYVCEKSAFLYSEKTANSKGNIHNISWYISILTSLMSELFPIIEVIREILLNLPGKN